MAVELAPGFRQVAEEVLRASRMKGIAVGVARGDAPPEYLFLGADAVDRPLAPDSLFPVASLTKLATALAVLRLMDTAVLAPDDPLARHLPEAVAAAHSGVTLRRLLSHTAGLPSDLPRALVPYAPGLDWPALAEACLRAPLSQQPLTRVHYSNVGYGLLALVVEKLTGQGFADALDWLVLKPLGIEGYLGQRPPREPALLSGIHGDHAGTDLEPFNSDFWRSLAVPWGGLITTAHGALALVRSLAGFPGDFLRPETRAEATRNQAGDLGGGFRTPLLWPRCPWGLGPELRDEKVPHWAARTASPDSFGHSGASGCVAWFDPPTGVAWTFLGTRAATSGWMVRRGPALGDALLKTSDE